MRSLSVILIVLFSGFIVAEAQVKNILLDPDGAYEPSVAINRSNTQNIVVSAAPDNIYVSENGGLSWEKTKLASTFGATASMTLVADFKGNFYCVHQATQPGKSSIVIRESTNGGKTWSAGVLISSDTGRYAVTPRAAVDRKGNIFVTWTEFDAYESTNDNCISSVLVSKSSNAKKWSKPVQLSQTIGNCHNDDNTTAGAIPSVMGMGERSFAVWSNQQKIFYDRAFDGGGMWLSNDLAITDHVGGWNINISGTKKANGWPTLICNNTKKTSMSGALFLTWADQQAGETDTDIWFTRSLNFGDNWDHRFRVNDDKPGNHQYMPAMALDSENGNIYILYYDRRTSANDSTEVYLAYTTDGGSSFKNVRISESPFASDASAPLGNFISIAVHSGVITAAWTRTENGTSSVLTSIIRHEELEKIK